MAMIIIVVLHFEMRVLWLNCIAEYISEQTHPQCYLVWDQSNNNNSGTLVSIFQDILLLILALKLVQMA